MIIDLVYHLDAKPKLAFLKTKNNESTKMSFKVTMGIMPDYTFEEKGLRLDGVTENKPASNAGLQQGDIILKMGDTDILNIQDYMKSLNSFNKGDEVQVLIQRRGEMMIKVVRF